MTRQEERGSAVSGPRVKRWAIAMSPDTISRSNAEEFEPSPRGTAMVMDEHRLATDAYLRAQPDGVAASVSFYRRG